MYRTFKLALLATALVAVGACSSVPKGAGAGPAKASNGVLTTPTGMTLYTSDADQNGKSACNGKCLFDWPPLFANEDATASGDWTIIDRDDGLRQWAYKGKPVYTFEKDKKAGDKQGDGVKGVWHAVKP